MKKLYYIEENPNKKDSILFLHPKFLGNWVFIKQENTFNNYNNLFIDLLGHGKSDFEEFSFDKCIDYLLDIIKEKNKKGEVHLVGIDLGGQIALRIFARYPDLIGKVIISGVYYQDKEEVKERKNSIVNFLDKTKRLILDKKDETFLIKAYLRHYGLKSKYYSLINDSYSKFNQEELKNLAYNNLNYTLDKAKDYKKASDLMIIYGDKESKTVQKSAYCIHELYKGSEIIKIKDGIELENIKNPNVINSLICDFLNELIIKDTYKIKNIEFNLTVNTKGI